MNTEFFEERAAIAEYEAGMSRADAEEFARQQEEHRFRCEVRQLLHWKANGNSTAIHGVMKRRPDAYRKTLVDTCKQQWDLGNRGNEGDWRE